VTLFPRVLVVCLAGLLTWSAAATQVARQVRLPAGAVVEGAVVTQPFGCTTLALEPFDPLCPGQHVHTGVDLSAPAGTPVMSATAGTARVGFDPRGPGLYVVIVFDEHVRILYCHLSAAGVATGEMVTAGEAIGRVGATGLATGPHLHLEVQLDGRSVDPVEWLAAAAP
jgi:murein DD-endopeptidase MepM/ murein hydrolase activator NlpD